jgi:coenzyme F420-reducing hydrogenase beta subunit
MVKNEKIIHDITKNCCIGCGLCSITKLGKMVLDKYGKYKVNIENLEESVILETLKVCPFSPNIQNESELANEIFNTKITKESNSIGLYLNIYLGFIDNEKVRMNSSSGGIITWLLLQLVEQNIIDSVIHVVPSNEEKVIFKYGICKNESEIISGASSKYYPVEMSHVLEYIRDNPGNYAIVALPCFTKGIRLLQKSNRVFKERIKFIITLVCGHLKTTRYSAFLAWQANINPQNLKLINFRKKIPERKASQYGTEFQYYDQNILKVKLVPNSEFKIGTNWGHGMFKYPACDYCDDVVGELGDISVGDAWLPDYIKDYKGNSLIFVRNPIIKELVIKGIEKKEIILNEVSNDLAEKSQVGGIRNKRKDLQFRLWLAKRKKYYFPPKRVSPSRKAVDFRRRILIRMRLLISEKSHVLYDEAIRKDDLKVFYNGMSLPLIIYKVIDTGLLKSVKKFIRNLM